MTGDRPPFKSVDAAAAGAFPTTHWSLVDRAGDSRASGSREALDQLIHQYRPALMAYLRRICRGHRDQLEDLFQSFLAEKMVRSSLIAHADRRKGRFRTFLKTVLSNYVRSEFRRLNAQKRAPDRALSASPLIDAALSDNGQQHDPDLFDVEWARTLLQQALDNCRAECMETGREGLWTIMSARLIDPALRGTEPATYEQLIARMGYSSPSQVWNALHAGKKLLSRHLTDLIAAYARDESEVQEEIHDLFSVLSRASRESAPGLRIE